MQCIKQCVLDDDRYNFSMGQLAFNQFPHIKVRYRYTNRDKNFKFRAGFGDMLRKQVEMWADQSLSSQEADFMIEKCGYKQTFVEWLRGWRANPDVIEIKQEGDKLEVEYEDYWYKAMFYEEPLLYTISELRFLDWKTWTPWQMAPDWAERIAIKADTFTREGVNLTEFGTRRRHSYEVQKEVVKTLVARVKNFRGTSNMSLAMKHGIKAIGTNAHQLTMVMQAVYGIRMCNRMAMEHWVKEYRGSLGIALTDTITTDYFLRHDFDLMFAKLFDGLRQDSGDPFDVGQKYIDFYKNKDIDPMSKIVNFSNALDTEQAVALTRHFNGKIFNTMCVGTHLTCDVGLQAMNHVIKAVTADCGYGPVSLVKFSDDPGKESGDPVHIAHQRKELGI